MEWRRPLSIALLVLILATLFIQRARKYGLVISHIYAIIVGLLSYATFYNLYAKFRTRGLL